MEGTRRHGVVGVGGSSPDELDPAGHESSVVNGAGSGTGCPASAPQILRSARTRSSFDAMNWIAFTTISTCSPAQSKTSSATSAPHRANANWPTPSGGSSRPHTPCETARSPHPAPHPSIRHDEIIVLGVLGVLGVAGQRIDGRMYRSHFWVSQTASFAERETQKQVSTSQASRPGDEKNMSGNESDPYRRPRTMKSQAPQVWVPSGA